MKHKSPKQLRIDKKKPVFMEPGIRVVGTDCSLVTMTATARGSRVEKLPSFEEYNPNKIHVARRRRAWKDHTSFPRGWIWQDYDPTSLLEDYYFTKIADGGWTENND